MVEAERVDVARWLSLLDVASAMFGLWCPLIAALTALSEFSDLACVAHFGGVLLAGEVCRVNV